MKKILLSVLSIAVVAGVAIGASQAFFSDTETSRDNVFTAGTIDISVAGQNPWSTTYPMELDKPCETNYINFTIKNVGKNPANVWKRINNVETDGGDTSFCGVASSEPEYVEGGGEFNANGDCVSTNYVEQNNLAAYMIYDMYICHGTVGSDECPMVDGNGGLASRAPDLTHGTGWTVIIPESNQVRIDNVNGVWIKFDDALAKGGALAVSQSYHLMAWDDAGVETITNWAQGDVMTFDIELEARQTSAPAPESEGSGLLVLKQKDPTTWEFIPGGANGTLAYSTSGSAFNYTLSASELQHNMFQETIIIQQVLNFG
jgi:predicted ribosomally synthesized peptide with SipW-like signal peptide